MTYTVASDDPTVATAAYSTTLDITSVAPGIAIITLTVTDDFGTPEDLTDDVTNTATVAVTVNADGTITRGPIRQFQ